MFNLSILMFVILKLLINIITSTLFSWLSEPDQTYYRLLHMTKSHNLIPTYLIQILLSLKP
nr:MAG TPA: hypothetical protein [Caudoviricetes sp.]